MTLLPPGEVERLARAIAETKKLLEESERILQEASGAFIRRAAAVAAQEPQNDLDSDADAIVEMDPNSS